MNILIFLVPASLTLGGLALAGFIWTIRHSQYEDLDGDAQRILGDEADAD